MENIFFKFCFDVHEYYGGDGTNLFFSCLLFIFYYLLSISLFIYLVIYYLFNLIILFTFLQNLEFAMKAAGLEHNGIKAYYRFITETRNVELHVPLMIIIGKSLAPSFFKNVVLF